MKTNLRRFRHGVKQGFWHLVLILVVCIFLYPLFYMFFSSFKELKDIFTCGIQLLPKKWITTNYNNVLTKLDVPRLLLNSLFVAGLTMTVKMITSILAAYGLVFIPNKHTGRIFYFFVITMFVPFSVIMLPNYLTLSKLNLINTLIGVVLPQLADATAIFRIRQAMRCVPKSLIEAARLDKVPHMTCMTKIVLPLVRPSVVSMAIFLFVNSWNEYFWPLLILRSNELQTITLATKYYSGTEGSTGWGNVMALAAISIALPLVLYLFAQRTIISTFMSSGIKE